MKAFWMCEDCQRVGAVTVDNHADVMTVLYRLDRAHQDTSPDCNNTGLNLRTLNITAVLKNSDIQAWAVEPLAALIEDTLP